MPTVEYDPADDDVELRMRRDLAPHRGVMVLVFGILGLALSFPALCCLFMALGGLGFSLTAWILGQVDLRAMSEHRMDPEGAGMTRAGWICGIIGTALSTLFLLLHGGIVVFQLVNQR